MSNAPSPQDDYVSRLNRLLLDYSDRLSKLGSKLEDLQDKIHSRSPKALDYDSDLLKLRFEASRDYYHNLQQATNDLLRRASQLVEHGKASSEQAELSIRMTELRALDQYVNRIVMIGP